MKKFAQDQILEAYEHARQGGQALHVHRIIVNWQKAPLCFRREVEAGRDIAHLLDQDRGRLVATVRKLGVRVVVVEHAGTHRQHVDLCSGPLRKALALCEEGA